MPPKSFVGWVKTQQYPSAVRSHSERTIAIGSDSHPRIKLPAADSFSLGLHPACGGAFALVGYFIRPIVSRISDAWTTMARPNWWCVFTVM